MTPPLAAAPRVSEEWLLTAVGGLDELLLACLAALAVGGLAWTWLALDPRLPLRQRLGITAPRAAALGLAVALLWQPTLRLLKLKPVPPRIAVLVDVSESMALGGDGSRLAEVRTLLERAAGAPRAGGDLEIGWYSYAGQLAPATGWRSAIAADGGRGGTDLARALEQLAARTREEPLSAVLVVSDGADTAAKRGAGGARDGGFAKGFGAPISTVAITRARRQRDLAITEVKADPFAFARSDAPIAVSLRSAGLTAKKVAVTLAQGGSVIQRREAELVGGACQVLFSYKPTQVGRDVLTVSTDVPPGDEVPQNNTAHLALDVLRDKVRVLHIAGHPSWDQRFLRDTLAAWPQIDLVSFYVLRTPFQSTALGSDGMTLIPFPTAELFASHLEEFDVLIFQDLNPADVGVDRHLDAIAGFVEGGGGLAVVGGERGFAPSAMARPPFADVLPIVFPPTGGAPPATATAIRAALTEAGRRHPLTRLADDEAENAALWDSFERLDGMVRLPGPSERGVVLATAAGEADGRAPPLLAAAESGAGRTVAIATDSLWRWRFSGPLLGGSAEAYPRLWRRIVDWLTRDPSLDRLKVEVTPPAPLPDQPVLVRVELKDESFRPTPHAKLAAEIGWADAAGVARSERIAVSLDADGRFSREWTPRETGPHTVRVEAPQVAPAAARFLVASRDAELRQLDPDVAFLRAVAEASGGQHTVDAIDLDLLPRAEIPTREVLAREDSPLWNHPLAFLLLFAALVGEWLLRRRAGLN